MLLFFLRTNMPKLYQRNVKALSLYLKLYDPEMRCLQIFKKVRIYCEMYEEVYLKCDIILWNWENKCKANQMHFWQIWLSFFSFARIWISWCLLASFWGHLLRESRSKIIAIKCHRDIKFPFSADGNYKSQFCENPSHSTFTEGFGRHLLYRAASRKKDSQSLNSPWIKKALTLHYEEAYDSRLYCKSFFF